VKIMLSEQTKARFDREVAKFPADQKVSAVMACLSIIQQEQGWVSDEAQELVAQYLQPVGKFKLNVCTNLPCQLRDGQKALEYLERKLGIGEGETTEDGVFTLQQCECLGACADAPVLLVNDRHMVSFMGNDKLDQLIDGLRKQAGA
jgi:NADH-quinone oxidoreductase subunit E